MFICLLHLICHYFVCVDIFCFYYVCIHCSVIFQENLTQDITSSVPSPHLVCIGDPHKTDQFFVVAEGIILLTVEEFLDGIADLMAVYYVCNFNYPKLCELTYKFLQIKGLQVPDGGEIPPKLVNFVRKIE